MKNITLLLVFFSTLTTFGKPESILFCKKNAGEGYLELDLYPIGHPMGGMLSYEGVMTISGDSTGKENLFVKPEIYYQHVKWMGTSLLTQTEYLLDIPTWSFENGKKQPATLYMGLFKKAFYECEMQSIDK